MSHKYDSVILEFRKGHPDLQASLTTYTEMIHQQGFPETHAQFLRELQAWLDTNPALRERPKEALQSVLDIEANFLTDAGVAGMASEHLPWLYTIFGETFAERCPDFQQVTRDEASLAENTYEDAISQHMQETGCDRLEAVQYMKGASLERLQERQDRLRELVARLMGDD